MIIQKISNLWNVDSFSNCEFEDFFEFSKLQIF